MNNQVIENSDFELLTDARTDKKMAKFKESLSKEAINDTPESHHIRLKYRKDAMIAYIDHITELAEAGEVNPALLYEQLKHIEKSLAKGMAKIKEAAIQEVRRHGKGRHQIGESFMEVSETTSYNYDEYDEYVQYKAMVKDLESKLKTGFTDLETGKIYPKVSRGGTEMIRITKL